MREDAFVEKRLHEFRGVAGSPVDIDILIAEERRVVVPNHVALHSYFEDATAVRFANERVAVGEALLSRPKRAEEAFGVAVFPKEVFRLAGVEFQDPGISA